MTGTAGRAGPGLSIPPLPRRLRARDDASPAGKGGWLGALGHHPSAFTARDGGAFVGAPAEHRTPLHLADLILRDEAAAFMLGNLCGGSGAILARSGRELAQGQKAVADRNRSARSLIGGALGRDRPCGEKDEA